MLRAFALGVSLFLAGSALAEGTKPATPEGAPAASPITIEDFGGLPFFQDPSLSPNGQFLAARLAGDGKQTLSIISLFDKSIPTRSYNIDSEEMSLDGWQWVNDEWLVATVSRTVPVEGDTWRVSRIIGIGRNSQKLVTPLWDDAAQNASDILWVARDGSPRLLFGMQTSIFSDEDGFYDTVYEVDISKGKTRKIVSAKAPITSYFADASGFVRMGYGYDYSTRKSRLTYRAPGEGTFHVIDRADPAQVVVVVGAAVGHRVRRGGHPGLQRGQQFVLAVDQVAAVVVGQLVVVGHGQRPGRASLDAQAAEDAAQHVDLEVDGIAFSMRMGGVRIVLCGFHVDGLSGTDDGAKFASDTALLAIFPFGEIVASA